MNEVQMIEEIVLKYLGTIPNNRGDFYTICPHCGKKKLNINLNKGVFKCPYCNASGGFMKLNALFLGHYPNELSNEELKKLLKESGIKSEYKGEYVKKTYEPEPIDYKKNHKAYLKFFKSLSLTEEDQNYLKQRGLTNLSRYKSFDKNVVLDKVNPKDFVDVPGFFINKNGQVQTASTITKTILFPYIDIYGNIVSFQLRVKNNNIGCKYIYFSSKKKNDLHTVSSYCLLGNIEENKPIVITEGALKADAARQIMQRLGKDPQTYVAVPGVNAISSFLKDIEEFKARGVKEFYLAFDMDWKTNEHVKKALVNLNLELVTRGFKVKTLKWDTSFKGIDDYLYSKLEKKRNEK